MIKSIQFIFLTLLTLLIFTSCGDEDCELTELDEIIIGTWEVAGSDVTFNEDGSLIDRDNIFEGEINGIQLLEKSYSLEGDSIITIRTFSSDPPASLGFDLEIDEYDCNEIETTLFLLSYDFKKK